ncbi:MAG: hydrogenase maturation nickel metallochaperone HypA [Candidatus Fermentibacter sp.]|nr:hydrogenase maturation nickel metallochaperone HypA [Candidatus Fermentibacter sp.]
MHELSVASEILDVVEEALGHRESLRAVDLVLGPLSGVSAEALDFCFTEMASQRGFGRPVLRIRPTVAVVKCAECGASYEASDLAACCPACGGVFKQVLSGRECSVESIETSQAGPS